MSIGFPMDVAGRRWQCSVMRDDQHQSEPDHLTKSRVICAWQAERAAAAPTERRHAMVVTMVVVAVIAGLSAAITLGRPFIAPAMKATKAAIKNLL